MSNSDGKDTDVLESILLDVQIVCSLLDEIRLGLQGPCWQLDPIQVARELHMRLQERLGNLEKLLILAPRLEESKMPAPKLVELTKQLREAQKMLVEKVSRPLSDASFAGPERYAPEVKVAVEKLGQVQAHIESVGIQWKAILAQLVAKPSRVQQVKTGLKGVGNKWLEQMPVKILSAVLKWGLILGIFPLLLACLKNIKIPAVQSLLEFFKGLAHK